MKMNTILQYILAIAGFSIIILVHECGHFLLSKLNGIHVEEFFIGMGPKLAKFKSRSGTTYGISAIPLGGYNKILGFDRSESIPDDKKSKAFFNKPFYKKFLVIAGGGVFNVIFAILLIGIFLSMGIYAPVNVVEYVQPDSPADRYGFKTGDKIIALNDEKVEDWDKFSQLTKSHPGELVTYTVLRNGEQITIEVKLDDKEGQGFLGISPKLVKKKIGLIEIIRQSFKITWEVSISYVKLFGMLFTGALSFAEARPVSPVGVINIFQQSASMGFQNFVLFVALVSLLLAFGNLIPILPLDGGHLVILIIETIKRRPVTKKVLEVYNAIGLVIVMSMLIIGFIFDIISPFSIQNL
ncbi:MAG: site-2 protease family protein [Actinobacteria bacterium]|nr:site-2 protease family protein [Actinomycetota bacterium]